MLTYHLYLSIWILVMYGLHLNAKPNRMTRWLWLTGPAVAYVPFLIPESSLALGQPIVLPDVQATLMAYSSLSIVNWLELVYYAGVGVVGIMTIRRVVFVYRIKRQSQRVQEGGLSWYELPPSLSKHGAFSFFGWIFLPPSLDVEMRHCMYLHEEIHQQKGHSLDILMVNLLKIVFWFNPFIYLMQSGLKDCHEYEADFATSKKIGATNYANALVSTSFGLNFIMPIVHPFGSVRNIKSRIHMLHTAKTPRFAWLWMLAICASFISFQACSKTAENKSSTPLEDGKLADRNAEFPGGMEALVAFVTEHLQYPEEAKGTGVEGKVFVEFTVGVDGSVLNPVVKQELDPILDAAAISIVEKMPKWNPAIQDGKSVASSMVLPVSFVLD